MDQVKMWQRIVNPRRGTRALVTYVLHAPEMALRLTSFRGWDHRLVMSLSYEAADGTGVEPPPWQNHLAMQP